MGNDGGSIPTRRELVKNAARDPNTTEVKAAQLESQTHHWTYCPLSRRPLAAPIVSDCAGILYNKDAVIEYLLPSSDPSPPVKSEQEELLSGRIKSLRDVVEVKFQTENDAVTKEERRICPITSKQLGAKTKAVYLIPCGHAFSEAAIKEVSGDACIECNEPYKAENIIPILPLVKEDIARLAERIKALNEAGLTHSLKKGPGSKKRKKQAGAERVEASNKAISNSQSDKDNKAPRTTQVDKLGSDAVQSRSGTATPTGIKNAATASLTAKVLDEQEERNKRRKLGLNDNLKSLFSNTGSNGSAQKGGDFMTRGFSIPKRA